jgi:hypothetical protein
MDKEDFYSGWGMVRAIPGPVFSVATYMGGIAMKDRGVAQQIMGCFIGATGIFLPSALAGAFFLSDLEQPEKICDRLSAHWKGSMRWSSGSSSLRPVYDEGPWQDGWKDIGINLAVIGATWALLSFYPAAFAGDCADLACGWALADDGVAATSRALMVAVFGCHHHGRPGSAPAGSRLPLPLFTAFPLPG